MVAVVKLIPRQHSAGKKWSSDVFFHRFFNHAAESEAHSRGAAWEEDPHPLQRLRGGGRCAGLWQEGRQTLDATHGCRQSKWSDLGRAMTWTARACHGQQHPSGPTATREETSELSSQFTRFVGLSYTPLARRLLCVWKRSSVTSFKKSKTLGREALMVALCYLFIDLGFAAQFCQLRMRTSISPQDRPYRAAPARTEQAWL